jgi:AcrR family transcriptional regulator
LVGAAKEFVAHGYRDATLQDVVSSVEVTTGAFYFHFKSKEELAWAILEEQHRLSTERAECIISEGHSAVDTLTHLSASMGRDIMTDPIVHAGVALATETQIFDEPYLKSWEDWIQSVEFFLHKGVEEGDVDPNADIDALAHLIGPAFAGIKLASEIMTHSTDLLQRLHELSNALIPAFAAPGKTDQLKQSTREIFAEYSRSLASEQWGPIAAPQLA